MWEVRPTGYSAINPMNSSSVGVSIERRSAETKLADCHRKARFQLNFDSLGRDPRIPLALLIIHRDAWESSRDYNPSAGLERITAALLLINSAQDERNPPET